MNTMPPSPDTRKTYEAPQVVVHGDVSTLTLDILNGAGKNDNAGNGNQKSGGL